MVRSAWSGAQDADAVVHLVDVQAELAVTGEGKAAGADKKAVQDVHTIIEGLKGAKRQAILALNKIDGVKRDRMLAVAKALFDTGVYSEVFMISAATGAGVEDLRDRLAGLMPEGPWLYPEDQTADLPVRLLAAELTREKLYLRVHEELPTPPRWRPPPSRNAATARCASNRPSTSNATASGRSSSARTARP